jgi:hypothetical protein
LECTSLSKDVKDFKDLVISQLKQVDMYFHEYKDVEDFKDVGMLRSSG